VSEHRHPQTGQPVGAPVDGPAGQRPGPITLIGRFGRLEKLTHAHAPSLWQAVKDNDRLWTYMPNYSAFPDAITCSDWVAERATLDDPYSYAIVEPQGRVVGITALMEIRPAMRVIEVGGIVYSPALQRTPLATEAQYLLARYAFETLGYRRYEWKCDALNAASRRAALRFGFTFEGILRQHQIARGRNRDTAYYSMLDSEWPARKLSFERWLSPQNFTADDKQKISLSELNGVTE
jgi:RimJ/RimL family protein N-acetyltransferase